MERTCSYQLYLLLSSGMDVTCNCCNCTLWKVGSQLLSVCIHILIALSSGSSTRLRKFALEAEAHSCELSNICLKFCARPVSSVSPALQIPLLKEGFLEALPKAIPPKDNQEKPSCQSGYQCSTICCVS